jgi:hypothetical protein
MSGFDRTRVFLWSGKPGSKWLRRDSWSLLRNLRRSLSLVGVMIRRSGVLLGVTGLVFAGWCSAAWAAGIVWSGPDAIDHQVPFSHPDGLSSLSCARSGQLCVAIDLRGAGSRAIATGIVTSTDPTGGASAWTETNLAGLVGVPSGLTSVSCPSTHFCAIATGGGEILTSHDPTGGPVAWKASSTPASLSDLVCVTARLCVAINSQMYYASAHPAAGKHAWRSVYRSGLQLERIACASAHLCIATGALGYSQTTPAVAFVITRPLGGFGSWRRARLSHNPSGTSVTCPSVRLCAIGGLRYVLTSTRPADPRVAWQYRRVPFASDLACPTARLCVAITGVATDPSPSFPTPAEEIISRHPGGGPTAWRATPQTAGAGADVSLSCPSARQCVAVDERDQVFTTRTPVRRTSSWPRVNLSLGNSELTGVSCGATTGCVAVDDSGRILANTDPNTPYSEPWSTRSLSRASLDGVSCTPGLCSAIETDYPEVITFTAGSALTSQFEGITPTQISCASADECAVSDSDGAIHVTTDRTGSNATWSDVQLTTTGYCEKADCSYTPLTGVSCPSTQLCAATDGTDFYASTDTSGDAADWTDSPLPGHADAIDCPTNTMCVAISGQAVSTTTDPAAPTPTWTTTSLPSVTLPLDGYTVRQVAPSSLSCPTTTECVAVDIVAGYTLVGDPTTSAWTLSPLDSTTDQPGDDIPALTSVSCEPGGTCVAVDGAGNAFTGTLTDNPG